MFEAVILVVGGVIVAAAFEIYAVDKIGYKDPWDWDER